MRERYASQPTDSHPYPYSAACRLPRATAGHAAPDDGRNRANQRTGPHSPADGHRRPPAHGRADQRAAGRPEPIYLAIIWHQHQPVYYKDPETGIYIKPWVRLHAAKDYVDMAAILQEYPDIKATFNLTPSLIRQLDDLGAGATDLYWQHTIIPADELSDEQKQFILDHFFDTNRKIIARFPRYQE
ncbi:MAG TPA: hypothetical protein PLR07_11790, partial [Promineifilum sp.]|nr:hypothetical protein [Promineifilum sp.]